MTRDEWLKQAKGLPPLLEDLSGRIEAVEPYPEHLTGAQRLSYRRQAIVALEDQRYLVLYDGGGSGG